MRQLKIILLILLATLLIGCASYSYTPPTTNQCRPQGSQIYDNYIMKARMNGYLPHPTYYKYKYYRYED